MNMKTNSSLVPRWIAMTLVACSMLSCHLSVANGQDTKPSAVELVDIRDVPLGEALRILSDQTDLNLAASSDASKVSVSLHLKNVSPMAVIATLAKTHGLYYKTDEETGIITLHTVQEYRRELTSFRDDKTEVFTMLYPNAVDVATAIRDLYGNRVQLSLGTDERDSTDELEERFDRFDILNERGQGLGFFEGSGFSRGGSSFSRSSRFDDDGRSRSSFSRRSDILRDVRRNRDTRNEPRNILEGLTAEDIQRLEAALAGQEGLNATAIQELLRQREATIYVTVVKRHNQIAIRTSDDTTMKEIEKLIRRLDVPTPLVMLEVKIMAVDLGDGFQSAFDFQFKAGESAGGFTSGDIVAPTGDSFSLGGSDLISGGLAFQYVGNQFRARMQVLEDQNRVTALATPLLLTANNEVSRLFVGEEVPLNRSFGGSQTIVGDSTVITPGTTDIEFRAVGTTLLLTPNINADRTVTLRILQEVSSISPTPANVLVPDATGFVEQEVDVVQSRSVSGTIVAKDGLAVALGGLIEEQLVDSEEKVPLLGELPGLGILFRRDVKDRTRKELVIMVRPYVLNTPAESDRISRQLLEELSMHPNSPDAKGQLGTHSDDEVLRPMNEQQRIRQFFRFHSINPENRE